MTMDERNMTRDMTLEEYFDMREDILKQRLRNEKYFLNCLRDGERLKD